MTSPQTSDPKIDDDQPNMEIDWPSDAEFSFILDDSCSETRQQSLEEPLPEIRPTAEETQKTPAENLQPTRNAPPRLVDDNASTPNPVGSNVSPPSEPLLQISPGTDAMGTECGSKPLLKPEQEREAQFKFLRYKLQKGFLPEGQQPRADNMKNMSLYLEKLEQIEIPSRIVADDTRIRKVLKKILNLDQIPKNGKFSFKERVARLLEKWKESWEKEEPITASSTAQPTSDYGSELSAILDNWDSIGSSDAAEASEIGVDLMEDVQPEIVAESEPSCKPTSGHGIDPSVIRASQYSTPPPLPVERHPSKSTSERLVIDLTKDDEADTDTGSELSSEPTGHHNSQHGVVKREQTTRSELSLDFNQPVPCNIFEDSASSLSDMSGSSTKKRKWSEDTTSDRSSSVSDSDAGRSDPIHPGNLQGSTAAATKPINENKPTSRRKKQKTSPRQKRKTSPRQHLINEMSWVNGSVQMIDVMLAGIQEELKANTEKSTRFLEETAAERKTIVERRDGLIELKRYQLAWGAQDEKVTDEWEPSE